jgi:cell division septum initiation protein DivIVA
MAHSETRGSESLRDTSTPTQAGGGAVDFTGAGDRDGGRTTRRLPTAIISAPERERMIEQARATEFPIALRGYDRGAVDRYVEHVNRLLAELEISSSPESAVRHALDEVSEETRDILQRAHDTAEEITARSRSRADDRLQEAEQESKETRAIAQREAEETRQAAQQEGEETREAAQREAAQVREIATRESLELRETAARESQQLRTAAQRETDELRASARAESEEMREAAETRARELARSAETIWRERRRLIDDMRGIGEQLVAIGEVEGKRFARLPDEMPLAADEHRQQLPATRNGEPAPAS